MYFGVCSTRMIICDYVLCTHVNSQLRRRIGERFDTVCATMEYAVTL